MDIRLPKTVTIRNYRLSFCYLLLVTAAFAYVLRSFFVNEVYYGQISMDEKIQVSLWVNGVQNPSYGAMQDAFQASAESSFCLQPENYDYWWSSEWRYVNHSCITLCPQGSVAPNCASLRDLYVTESPSQAVLLTQIQDSWYSTADDENGSGGQTDFYFFPAVEALGVGFQYSYDLTYGDALQYPDPWFDADKLLQGASTQDVLTVIVDPDDGDRVLREFLPGSISLTVPELLEYAGRPDLLEEPQDTLGRNMLERMQNSRYAAGPAARVSGVDVTLKIDCKNFKHQVHLENKPPEVSVVCYVKVLVQSAWTNTEKVDIVGMQGQLRHRQYHGIRVKVETTGYIYFYDFNNIYLYIVAGIVVMQLPNKLMVLFVRYCLGYLSVIYTRALNDSFSLSEQVAGIATRMMANSLVFQRLERETNEEGISKQVLAKRLRQGLKHRADIMDANEVESFINHCYESILKENAKMEKEQAMSHERSARRRCCRFSVMDFLPDAFRPSVNMDGAQDHHVISIDDFNKACSSNDPLSFECVVNLFDKDRYQHIVERFFTPSKLKKSLQRAETEAELQKQIKEAQGAPQLQQSGSDVTGVQAEDGTITAQEFLTMVEEQFTHTNSSTTQDEIAGQTEGINCRV